MNTELEIRPYTWAGPYAEMRTKNGWEHDAGLCAEVRAGWMGTGERLILRTSEIVAYETGYLYDDHFPPCEQDGRGKGYRHIPFRWRAEHAPTELWGRFAAPGKGEFGLALRAREDYVDIEIFIRNDLGERMGKIDWHFCVVGYDLPGLGDPELSRTYLYDGEKLRTLAELAGGPKCIMHQLAGAEGFLPVIHRNFERGPVEAKAPIVIVEGADGKRSAALSFERSYAIFSNPTNRCFHAEPYFGPIGVDEERRVRGRLYLMEGKAEEALGRWRRDKEGKGRTG
ncbi:MAG: hypothetical protein V2A58_17950 [Planctomycetota bacterium]